MVRTTNDDFARLIRSAPVEGKRPSVMQEEGIGLGRKGHLSRGKRGPTRWVNRPRGTRIQPVAEAEREDYRKCGCSLAPWGPGNGEGNGVGIMKMTLYYTKSSNQTERSYIGGAKTSIIQTERGPGGWPTGIAIERIIFGGS